MRLKFSDLPKELFPVNKKFGGVEFNLQRCNFSGAGTYIKEERYRGWGSPQRGGCTHINFKNNERYLEFVLKERYLKIDTLAILQEAIADYEITYISVQPTYNYTNKIKDLKTELWNLEPKGAYVTLWVKIPLTEKQSRAVDHAADAEKERKATEKAKQRAADKAEKDRKGAAQAAREREARLAEAKRVGKTTVTDVAEALMILQKAGLKVVTIEEKK
jgi:hypothetical protein